MRWFVIIILVLGAHLTLTTIAPGEAGKTLFYWPFAVRNNLFKQFADSILIAQANPEEANDDSDSNH